MLINFCQGKTYFKFCCLLWRINNNCLFCISTSKRVLRTLLAGGNRLSDAKTTFYITTEQNKQFKTVLKFKKKLILLRSQPAFWCQPALITLTRTILRGV